MIAPYSQTKITINCNCHTVNLGAPGDLGAWGSYSSITDTGFRNNESSTCAIQYKSSKCELYIILTCVQFTYSERCTNSTCLRPWCAVCSVVRLYFVDKITRNKSKAPIQYKIILYKHAANLPLKIRVKLPPEHRKVNFITGTILAF